MILTSQDIQEILPHRYPFLMVDGILEIEADKRIVGIKNVSINEPFFQGHFPGDPVMPGVLILEALAQVSGVLSVRSIPGKSTAREARLLSMGRVKFRKVVRPGDQLRLEVEVKHRRDPVWKMECLAKVNGEVVAEAELVASLERV